MVYFDPRNDITNDVIYNLNRRYKAVVDEPRARRKQCGPARCRPSRRRQPPRRPTRTERPSSSAIALMMRGRECCKAKRRQRTLAHAAEVRGHGFFHGSDVTLRFRPAEPGTGVVFERIDLPDRPRVPARIDRVVPVGAPNHDQARRRHRRDDRTRDGRPGRHARRQLRRRDRRGRVPGLRRLEPRFRRGVRTSRDRRTRPDARRSSCSKARWSIREGDASLAANPGAPGELTLAYHLDYGPDAPIHAHSFCVGLSPETFKRSDRSQPHLRHRGRSEFASRRRASACGRPRPIC